MGGARYARCDSETIGLETAVWKWENKMAKKILVFFIILVLFGCQREKQDWNPIFEETSFDYFTDSIDRSVRLIDDAYSEAEKNASASVKNKLDSAKSSLLEIKNYYVPLTAIRQKIFDAERYFKVGDLEKAKKLLEDSKATLAALDVKTKSGSFHKMLSDLTAMIDEVILTFGEESIPNTDDKMKKLWGHLNLMLYRGDLVLSGVKFDK